MPVVVEVPSAWTRQEVSPVRRALPYTLVAPPAIMEPPQARNATASVSGPARSPGRLPSLDGWRALSITLVLGAHCRATWNFPPSLVKAFAWGFDGEMGVRFFFVISGFLITWLLLAEQDVSGGVSLSRFYMRRALRILPIYGAFLLVLFLLQATTAYSQPAGVWVANLTFTTNLLEQPVWTSGHLWSLAVEEQFYLLWPCLFVALGCGRNLGRAVAILVVPLAVAPLARVIHYLGCEPAALHRLFTPYSFLIHFDSLAIGCAAALLLSRRERETAGWLTRRPLAAAWSGLAMVALPYVLARFLVLGIFTVPLGATFESAGAALLMVQSVLLPRAGLYRLLNLAWVAGLGVLSYSIYIWQEIFCSKPEYFGWSPHWWMAFPFWILPVMATAGASYIFWEKPFLSLRARFRR